MIQQISIQYNNLEDALARQDLFKDTFTEKTSRNKAITFQDIRLYVKPTKDKYICTITYTIDTIHGAHERPTDIAGFSPE